MNPRRVGEAGFSMFEVLAAIAILAVVALALANNTIKSYVFLKRSIRTAAAQQLAMDKVESLVALNPSTITVASGGTENPVILNKIPFTRVTTVTVNADGSRTVSVTVTANLSSAKATYTTTLPLWGNS